MIVEFHSVEKVLKENTTRLAYWHIQAIHTFQAGDVGWALPKDQAEGGEQIGHNIWLPMDTMEWRAAEYKLDPDDRHTLWDLVLAELYMVPEDFSDGLHLYGHHDLNVVRKAHLNRAARVKLRHRMATRNGHPVHDTVRDQSPIHPEALAIKKAHIDMSRSHHFRNRLAHQDPEEARVAGLREQFAHAIKVQWPTKEMD